MNKRSFLKSLACALIAIPIARALGATPIPLALRAPEAIVEPFNYEKYLAEMMDRNKDYIAERERVWSDRNYDGVFDYDPMPVMALSYGAR